jgi:hypothetical protein
MKVFRHMPCKMLRNLCCTMRYSQYTAGIFPVIRPALFVEFPLEPVGGATMILPWGWALP